MITSQASLAHAVGELNSLRAKRIKILDEAIAYGAAERIRQLIQNDREMFSQQQAIAEAEERLGTKQRKVKKNGQNDATGKGREAAYA